VGVHTTILKVGSKKSFKEECMKLPETAERALDLDTIINLATPEQRQISSNVKLICEEAISRLKRDLEFVWTITKTD